VSCGEPSPLPLRRPSTRRLAAPSTFLEQAVERGASVVRVSWHLNVCGGSIGDSARPLSVRRRVARHRDSRPEQLAFIRLILGCNADQNRLRALKPRRGFEERALLAAMQRSVTLRAVPVEIDVGRERDGAVVATRRGDRLHQSGKPRPGDIDWGTRALRPWSVVIARTTA